MPPERRSGFCHTIQLAGTAGSGLSQRVRGMGIICSPDQVRPQSSLVIPAIQPVVWVKMSLTPVCRLYRT